jgi:deoxyribodipyrimidine photo-lyase
MLLSRPHISLLLKRAASAGVKTIMRWLIKGSRMNNVPDIRIRKFNNMPVNKNGDYILYWMISYRRIEWNFSLQRAVEWALKLKKPLVILEALRCDYPWANDRFHRFIIEGMADNARRLQKSKVAYFPYIEPFHGAGKRLLPALSENACIIITDDFPAFFIPGMIQAGSGKVKVSLEAVDSNGLIPMKEANRIFTTAFSFRRFLQKTLPLHWFDMPEPEPTRKLKGSVTCKLAQGILQRWPAASKDLLENPAEFISTLPIDHGIPPVKRRGGSTEAGHRLEDFIENRLNRYAVDRNHPDLDGTSGLSPYLHFGHISAHRVFKDVVNKEGWSPEIPPKRATGSRTGWWGLSESSEVFLDQLITWRELGFNMCCYQDTYDRYESLPDWAIKTLKLHSMDHRNYIYPMKTLENAATHDTLWNSAQNQLLTEGGIHNYLRMLWAKKILEWSSSPEKGLEIMIELNNKYALDGRDPNSYSGIFWALGRYDRAWGERPVFGKIRYMSSENTAKKVKVKKYLMRYGGMGSQP